MQHGRLIDQRDGVDYGQETILPSLDNLLHKAGSSSFEPQSVLLLTTLAPCESDDPGDAQEWNLFDTYLNTDNTEESLYDRHSLSGMLQHWEQDVV